MDVIFWNKDIELNIRKYKATCKIQNAKNHQYSCLSNFLLESIEPHTSFVYIGSFSVVHTVL